MIDKIFIIYGFGIAVNAFLALLLLFRKHKSTADTILLVWLCFVCAHQFFNFIELYVDYKTYFSFLLGVGIPFPLTQAPFLFLYVSQLTDDSFLARNRKTFMLHFLPAILCYVYMAKFFMLPVEQKIYIIEHEGVGYEQFIAIKSVAILLSGVIYVPLALIKIYKYQEKIKNSFSNTEKINLQWLKILTYGIGVIWLVVFFGNQALIFVAVSFYISTLGFFGIKQVHIFSDNHKSDKLAYDSHIVSIRENIIEEPVIQESIKYENSGLSSSKKEIIENLLRKEVDENKLFLDPDLTLDALAAEINFHPNYVSQYINEVLGMTFYDYINSKRIEEFKSKVELPENKNLNLLGIAFDCGFNSKSTFNRNFKKLTGQTPTEYLQALKANKYQVA